MKGLMYQEWDNDRGVRVREPAEKMLLLTRMSMGGSVKPWTVFNTMSVFCFFFLLRIFVHDSCG